ncbi:MAG: lysylphosphatidylglycerol synthase transmembrane domain-containing protein [Microgenomates group bacterium]
MKQHIVKKLVVNTLSLLLLYFAFRKVDILSLLGELAEVPWWFVLFMVVYFFVIAGLSSVRWCWLVLDKSSWSDYWNFTRATYLGNYYSLFFPTSLAGDTIKWLPLLKKYSHLSKTKLLLSVVVDKIVGLSSFVLIGFASLLVGLNQGYAFPGLLLRLFEGLTLVMFVSWIAFYYFDLEKYLGKYAWLSKVNKVLKIIKDINRIQIIKSFFISLLVVAMWIVPAWFYSQIFDVGISVYEIFIFMPVITLALMLPISVAGFGARENLYLFFLVPLGYPVHKVLLVSTFGGLLGVLNRLLGGLLMFW